MANNGIRSQRASIYGNIGQQNMQKQMRTQGLNFQADQINAANRGAKSNLLSQGLGQMQQTYQHQQGMNAQDAQAMQQIELMRQIFPNMNFYDIFKQMGK